jgi:hypothetical protein
MNLSLRPILRTVPLLALAALFGACSDAPPTQPQVELRPAEGTLLSTSGSTQYTIVREATSSGWAGSVTVDPTVSLRIPLGKHEVHIPAGAVDRVTTFTLKKAVGTQVWYSLTAIGADGTNVGAAGFKKPIEVTVYYGDAVNVPDPTKLGLGWVVNGKVQEFNTPKLDRKKKTVLFKLDHFSEYALIWP